MRKIKDVLRLKFEADLSHERIGAALRVSKGAVTKYVQRALAAGLSWPVAPELDDAALWRQCCSREPRRGRLCTPRRTSR
ncbi:MAG: hypothetical protein IT514_12590 [Burkholderiales bacterium]|nr:hypothetical protein [Burkholderiales bacterium]